MPGRRHVGVEPEAAVVHEREVVAVIGLIVVVTPACSVHAVVQDRDDDPHDEHDAAEEAEVAEELVQRRVAGEGRPPLHPEEDRPDQADDTAHEGEHRAFTSLVTTCSS